MFSREDLSSYWVGLKDVIVFRDDFSRVGDTRIEGGDPESLRVGARVTARIGGPMGGGFSLDEFLAGFLDLVGAGEHSTQPKTFESFEVVLPRSFEVPGILFQEISQEMIFRGIETESLANTFVNTLKDSRVMATGGVEVDVGRGGFGKRTSLEAAILYVKKEVKVFTR